MHAYSSSQPAVDKHRKVLAVAKKRKAITPYIRFCSEQRPYLKEKYPDATFIELGKMFGRMWNQLTDEQKAELDRRLDGYHRTPDEGSPWGMVRERIRSKR